MIQHHANHHPVHKQIQSAFNTLESGIKLYGTLKAGYEVGSAIFRGAQSLYRVAAPLATAATALL